MGSHCQDLLYPAPRSGKDKTTMPLLQCPGPAPDFATHAVVNGNIGHVALKDYQGGVLYPEDAAVLRHRRRVRGPGLHVLLHCAVWRVRSVVSLREPSVVAFSHYLHENNLAKSWSKSSEHHPNFCETRNVISSRIGEIGD